MRLVHTHAQLGGVRQITFGMQQTGPLTFVLFGSGDVYSWDPWVTALSISLPGGRGPNSSYGHPAWRRSDDARRFGSGDVYAWDGLAPLVPVPVRSRSAANGGRRFIPVRSSRRRLYAWAAASTVGRRGTRLFQFSLAGGGSNSSSRPSCPESTATTLARFGSGDVYAWDGLPPLVPVPVRSRGRAANGGRHSSQYEAPDDARTYGSGDVYVCGTPVERDAFNQPPRRGGPTAPTAILPESAITAPLFGAAGTFMRGTGSGRLFQSQADLGACGKWWPPFIPARSSRRRSYAWAAETSMRGTPVERGSFNQPPRRAGSSAPHGHPARRRNDDARDWQRGRLCADGSNRLFQSQADLGGVRQMVAAIHPSTKLPTTLVRMGSGDVYSWDASGTRLFQSASQRGGVKDLRSGLLPSTNLPTAYARFGDGSLFSWNAAGIVNATALTPQYVDGVQEIVGVQFDARSPRPISGLDDRGNRQR